MLACLERTPILMRLAFLLEGQSDRVFSQA